MAYNESTQRFSNELEEISQTAERLQSRLDTQRSVSLNAAQTAYKKDFEVRAKYDEKSLKSSLDLIKKSQSARENEASGFTSTWNNALSDSREDVLIAGQKVAAQARNQYESYSEYANGAFQNSLNLIKETSVANASAAESFSSRWESAFSSTKTKATGFKGFMTKFLNDLGKESANSLLKVINESTSESPVGGIVKILTKTLGGFFADGGRPPVNKVSVVGERGPELFVPDTAGTIIPNERIGGGSSTINVNQYFSFQSFDPVTNMKMLEQQKNQIQQWVVDGIRSNQNNLRNAINGA